MQQIVNKIVMLFEREGVISSSDREIYAYGVDAALYTFISTGGLILIGCLLGKPIETLLIVSIFYVNQTLGGGFHATTHWKCFLTMTAGLLVCFLSFAIPFNLILCCGFAIASLLVMAMYPLVLHENKKCLLPKQSVFRKRSRLALLVQACCLWGVLLWGGREYIQAISAALTACAFSRLVAVCQQNKQRSKHD